MAAIVGSTQLAIEGGKPAITEPLPRFNTIGGGEERISVLAALGMPLSGYLGGERVGGYWVERLERKWEEMFEVKHAVACNSATSGILMACMVANVNRKTYVRTTPYTMSGTVAPARILGAEILFGDIEKDTFCLKPCQSDVVISVNLFGHPGESHNGFVIEDAAQSILASRNGKLISDANVTVFSGNVHKAVQCGEGGMCCTNDEKVADKLRMARNHGELAGYPAGLNLRLTEIQAAIWYEQLLKAKNIIAGRREIAETLSKAANEAGLGVAPIVREGCTHSYYIWALRCAKRDKVADALIAEGFPVKKGYVTPLYRLRAFRDDIHRPNVERAEAELITYENCLYDPSPKQLTQMCEAIYKVADATDNGRKR